MDKIRGRISMALFTIMAAAMAVAQSTINYDAGPGFRNVTYQFGTSPVPDGNEVQIGYFTSGFDVSGNAGNIFALASAWHELDAANIQTIFNQPGRFGKAISTSDPTFDNQKVCLWIFKTSDNGGPVANYGNVQAYGLYSSTLANWVFPVHDSLPPPNALVTSSEINQNYYGTFDPSHLILTAVTVPEPSTYALGGLALTFLFGRILRKRLK
jgi:hypothetical protein